MKGELEKFYDMVDGLEAAMMTTRRADGHLQSRPMATQKRAAGADLWFVTTEGTPKLDDLAHDPHVNLAYYTERNGEWVSVSGTAVDLDGPREDPRALRAGLEALVSRRGRPAPRHRRRSRAWCSSASPCTRPCFWRSTSPVRCCCSKREGLGHRHRAQARRDPRAPRAAPAGASAARARRRPVSGPATAGRGRCRVGTSLFSDRRNLGRGG